MMPVEGCCGMGTPHLMEMARPNYLARAARSCVVTIIGVLMSTTYLMPNNSLSRSSLCSVIPHDILTLLCVP